MIVVGKLPSIWYRSGLCEAVFLEITHSHSVPETDTKRKENIHFYYTFSNLLLSPVFLIFQYFVQNLNIIKQI